MKITRKKIALAFALFVAVVVGLAIAGSMGSKHTPTAPPPAATATQTPEPAPKPTPAPNERDDLNYFTLDDRTADGFVDVWVKYAVTNHSSKTSDYEIRWEAVNNATGVRVGNSTEFVTNVAPGQTATDAMPTVLTGGNVTLHVTSVDRTESY